MVEHVRLEHVSLQKSGATLSLTIESGQLVAVVGPAASGKSRLLSVIARDERPARGSVKHSSKLVVAGRPAVNRRTRPQEVARLANGNDAGASAAVLSALRLWEFRNSPVSQLSDSQVAAVELIAALSSPQGAAIIDGQIDRLDPWAQVGCVNLIRQRRQAGASFVLATNRPELADSADLVVLLKENGIRFAGTLRELLKAAPPVELVVETTNPRAVRAMTAPFEVSIRESAGTITITTAEHQELAAKLALDGYNDIRTIVVREQSVAEALGALIP